MIPGGVVCPPGEMRQRIDTHFGEGRIPACMAETILVALDECYDRARQLLRDNRERLDRLAAALLEHETLDADAAYEAAGVPRSARPDLSPDGTEPVG